MYRVILTKNNCRMATSYATQVICRKLDNGWRVVLMYNGKRVSTFYTKKVKRVNDEFQLCTLIGLVCEVL